jgi:hypothetical protein
MLSSKACLKAPRQTLSSGIFQMPGVITQLSPADQRPSPEAPTLRISIMRRPQVASSVEMMCLSDLLSSCNVTLIHPRVSIAALLPQRRATTSFRQTDLILSIRENNPSILTIQNNNNASCERQDKHRWLEFPFDRCVTAWSFMEYVAAPFIIVSQFRSAES